MEQVLADHDPDEARTLVAHDYTTNRNAPHIETTKVPLSQRLLIIIYNSHLICLPTGPLASNFLTKCF
jgi:hypothetical protein